MTEMQQVDNAPTRLQRATSRVRPRRTDLFGVVGWPLTIALLVIIAYPIVNMLQRTFIKHGSVGLGPLRLLIHDPTFIQSCKNTLIIVAIAGTSALIIGTLFAWLNERTDASWGVDLEARASHPPPDPSRLPCSRLDIRRPADGRVLELLPTYRACRMSAYI